MRPKHDTEKFSPFDYTQLSPDFSKLSRPAKRALIDNGIFTPMDLSRRTLKEVSELHGIGPSAIPILREALHNSGLRFKQ